MPNLFDIPKKTLADGRHNGKGEYRFRHLIEKPIKDMTRRDKVLYTLYLDHTLTQKEAYEKIGTTRLAARIHELRKEKDAPPIKSRTITVESRDGSSQVSEYYIPQADE